MPRKKHNDEQYAIEQVQKVISIVTEHKTKSWDDLWNTAYQWCTRNYTHAEQTAQEWGVAPIYLILASLLYVEHPLLVGQGRSWLYSMEAAQIIIIQTELHRRDIPVPILSTHSVHSLVD